MHLSVGPMVALNAVAVEGWVASAFVVGLVARAVVVILLVVSAAAVLGLVASSVVVVCLVARVKLLKYV